MGLSYLSRTMMATFCVAPLFSLVGCGASTAATSGSGGGGAGTGSTYTGPKVYVINNHQFGTAANNIHAFAANASGASAPISTITTESTTDVLNFISTDAAGNVYASVGTAAGPTYKVYAPATSGVSGGSKTVQLPASVGFLLSLVAAPDGQVFLTGQNEMAVFPAASSGVGIPSRTVPTTLLGGKNSLLQEPFAVAGDASGNAYVLNRTGSSGATSVTAPILIFGSTANGDVAPTRTIAGPLTTVTSPQGITVDTAGDIWVTDNAGPASRILEFGLAANGNVPPIATITPNLPQSGVLAGIKLDSAGNIYVLVLPGGSQLNPYVVRFAAGASGTIAPVSTFNSTQWTQSDAVGTLAVY